MAKVKSTTTVDPPQPSSISSNVGDITSSSSHSASPTQETPPKWDALVTFYPLPISSTISYKTEIKMEGKWTLQNGEPPLPVLILGGCS
mmetsp:Transcript_20200/g.40817  ORF Transcript_20200/g.40817 Transcript_20200/m.40817 type:complete len:89 (-) Transcript_20200:1126-1392(-)